VNKSFVLIILYSSYWSDVLNITAFPSSPTFYVKFLWSIQKKIKLFYRPWIDIAIHIKIKLRIKLFAIRQQRIFCKHEVPYTCQHYM